MLVVQGMSRLAPTRRLITLCCAARWLTTKPVLALTQRARRDRKRVTSAFGCVTWLLHAANAFWLAWVPLGQGGSIRDQICSKHCVCAFVAKGLGHCCRLHNFMLIVMCAVQATRCIQTQALPPCWCRCCCCLLGCCPAAFATQLRDRRFQAGYKGMAGISHHRWRSSQQPYTARLPGASDAHLTCKYFVRQAWDVVKRLCSCCEWNEWRDSSTPVVTGSSKPSADRRLLWWCLAAAVRPRAMLL